MHLRTCTEALQQGATHYFTGQPCCRGHLALRLTSNRNCVECRAEIVRRHYYRNQQKILQTKREYAKKNKHKILSRNRLRKAGMRQAKPGWVDSSAIHGVYKEAARLTSETGLQHHVDHIVPLRNAVVCGLHVPWNLQVIPASENLMKGNKLLGDIF